MTKRPTARQIARFASLTDAQLETSFHAIGTKPEHRVKGKGFIKLAWAKYGDLILAEQTRRRQTATEN
jgi:hypothetical protein